MLRTTTIAVYILLIVCMATATILEKMYGTQFASDHIYGSWWFVAMWAALAVCAVIYLIRSHMRPAVLMMHMAFIGILAGAFVTYLTAERGNVHITSAAHGQKGMEATIDMPFDLRLVNFHIEYYPGTDAPMDYVSTIATLSGEMQKDTFDVSMNNIAEIDGYRFYQAGYDDDMQGTHLLVTHDPYGIAVTYVSYLLLLISILWIIMPPVPRKLLRHTGFRKALTVFVLLLGTAGVAKASPSAEHIATAEAEALSSVACLYNGRICPLNTAATDFVQKLSGKPTWQGMSANEIFLSWMIFYDEWERKPIIKVKSSEVQRIIGIDDSWASLRDFYTPTGEYKLQAYMNDISLSPAVRKAVREADEKVRIISMFYAGEFTRIFPLDTADGIRWYSPGSTELPRDTPVKEYLFIKRVMDQVVQAVLDGDTQRTNTLVAKIRNYQNVHAPVPATLGIEVFYNRFIAWRWIVMLFLTLSIAVFFVRWKRNYSLPVIHYSLIAYTTLALALRWIVSGHVPVSNGFETMLFMAWVILVAGITPYARSLGAGCPLLASFALLVAMLANGSPQITPLMPVLQSPLLTIHVMVIMAAYALFAIQALQSSAYLLKASHSLIPARGDTGQLRLAVFLLTIGIFTGAVWANVSWGRYWGWDPKETWALITLMIYAVPLHHSFFPYTRRAYHVYIVAAFLTVLMTYFGVNYMLTGMHSYA